MDDGQGRVEAVASWVLKALAIALGKSEYLGQVRTYVGRQAAGAFERTRACGDTSTRVHGRSIHAYVHALLCLGLG